MQNRTHCSFVFLLLVSAGLLSAQTRVGQWDAYTSSRFLRDADVLENHLYAASSGGLLDFDIENETFRIFGLETGIERLDLQAIGQDAQGMLWLGSSSPVGEIYRWDPQSQELLQVFDHHIWGEYLTAITAFGFAGEDAFVACQQNVDWGILHFERDGDAYRYRDFYFNLPSDIFGLNAITIYEDTLWVSTSAGVLYAAAEGIDLKSPSAWHKIEPWGESSAIVISDSTGELYTNLGTDIYRLQQQEAQLYNSSLGKSINHLAFDAGEQLLAATNSGAYRFRENGAWQDLCDGKVVENLAIADGSIWSVTDGRGLTRWQDGTKKAFVPNTPVDNAFTSIYVDKEGNLAAATRNGISFLTEAGWYNVVASDTTKIHDRSAADWDFWVADTLYYSNSGRLYTILQSGSGEYFATLYGSYISRGGGGLLRLDPDLPGQYTVYDTTEGHFAGSEGRGGTSDFVAVGYLAEDAQGNLWMANQYAQNDQVVSVRTAEDEWIHFDLTESNGYLTYLITSILFDADGRIWFGSEVGGGNAPSSGGIAILDYNGTLTDKSDDEWFRVSTLDGLSDNSIFAMAIGLDGEFWIMTIDGIQRGTLARNFPNPIFARIENPVLTSVPFSKECRIRVDGLNNKWIGSVGSGVKVFTKNGIWLNDVEGFTTRNSGLLDDTILDIAFDNPRGLVYIATTKGISVYQSSYAVYGDTYQELKIFPQPFEIPAPEPLVIDGLLQESEVKIMTLDGTFIRHLYARNGTVIGQQAFWDGRNHRGDFVGSGVFICMAYTKEGDTTVGKIAVIRK